MTSPNLVLTRQRLLRGGFSDRQIAGRVSGGSLVTVLPGVYVERAVAASARRDRGLATAVLLDAARARYPGGVIASHTTAATLLDIPVVGEHPSCEVTSYGRRSRRLATPLGTIVLHAGSGEPADTVLIDGRQCTTPLRTTCDLARTFGRDGGVVAADALLRRGEITSSALAEAADALGTGAGVRTLRWLASFADGLAESPLESIVRVGVHEAGLPAPLLQRWIAGRDGRLIGRVDMLWRDCWTVLEADGMAKYTSRDDIAAEKVRQERLEQAGYVVVRVRWDEAWGNRKAMGERIGTALARGRALHAA